MGVPIVLSLLAFALVRSNKSAWVLHTGMLEGLKEVGEDVPKWYRSLPDNLNSSIRLMTTVMLDSRPGECRLEERSDYFSLESFSF